MNLLWLIASAALVVAMLAWARARKAARQAEQLSQMYWELKYQQGELRAQLHRGGASAPAPQPPPAPNGIIPLSSLKR